MTRLIEDYFCNNVKHSARDFERRFRIPIQIFDHLLTALNGRPNFPRRSDGLQRKEIHPIQRTTAALRMLKYGVADDALDDYLKMSENFMILSTKPFCEEVLNYLASSIFANRQKKTWTWSWNKSCERFSGMCRVNLLTELGVEALPCILGSETKRKWENSYTCFRSH